jgi:WD40 repeat protein
MKDLKPKFMLARVYDDGSREEPEIAPLSQAIDEARMSRRGFLGAGLTASAALLLLDGCRVRTLVSRADDGECGKTYAHADDVTGLALSADGSMLVSGSKDGAVKCWDLTARRLLKTFRPNYANYAGRLAVNPEGTKTAFAVSNGKTELRSLPDGQLLQSFDDGRCCEFTPDGTQLVIARKGYLDFYRLSDGVTRTIPLSSGNDVGAVVISDVNALAVGPGGNLIAVGTRYGNLTLSDGEGNVLRTFDNFRSIFSLAFSPDEQRLAVSYEVSPARYGLVILSLPEGKQLYDLKEVYGGPRFSPNGQWLYWGKPKPGALHTDTFSQKDLSALKNELTMVLSPDGRFLVTGGRGGSIKVWRLPDLTFSNCLMDVECSGKKVRGSTYNYTDEWGQTFSYTQPCGSPIPDGAACTCNCVPGKMEQICTCDRVCTCNRVCSCQSVGSSVRYYRVCVCLAV